MTIIRSTIKLLKETHFGRTIRLWRHERYFKSAAGYASHRGVYKTFAEANASAPENLIAGEHTFEYPDRIERIFPYDYPVLFWMQPIIKKISRIFDIGGNIGVHFYSYQRYLSFPDNLKWQVFEVPEIVRAGEERARGVGESRLTFTSSLSSVEDVDLIYAAGSIQYIESPSFPELLNKYQVKPTHIIINKIPLYDGEGFVTLQNGGNSFYPYQVFNRTEFINSVTEIGYQLVDSWIIPERNFWLPCDPARSFGPSSGLYFELKQ